MIRQFSNIDLFFPEPVMVMSLINCWLSLHVLSPEIKVEKTMETCLSQPPTAGLGFVLNFQQEILI